MSEPTLCVGARPCSVSGSGTLWPSLCRGLALSVSGPGALFVRLSVGVCVGARRSLCRGPAFSVRQTKFCERRLCSETLGCPFRCFGRPWNFLLRTIQWRVIESVLMTSRPPIIYYTLCYILYTIYFRVFTAYYRLYSVYMVYLYVIARPLKGGNQVLHTSLPPCGSPTII